MSLSIGHLYKVAYNFVCTIGWALVLANIVREYLEHPQNSRFFRFTITELKYVQTLAIMEVLHCILGIVRAPVFTTMVQVASRLFVLWGILLLPGNAAVQKSVFFPSLCIAWSLSELIRYPFYACELILGKDNAPRILTWLRYSGFLILYPLGITAEVMVTLLSWAYVMQNKPYTIELPNKWNFGVDFRAVYLLVLLSYIPGSPFMYKHMLRNRRKALGKPQKAKKE